MKNKVDYKPEGFHSVTPYLCVKGAARLLDFLKKAFGAEELVRFPRPDGSIAHACVKIGDSVVELGDVTEETPVMPSALHLYLPDVDEAYERAVKAGGTSLRKPEDKLHGERSGAVKDMCGNHWYLATKTAKPSKNHGNKRSAKATGHRG